MKKLFLLLATLTICIVANAQNYALYVEGAVASNGEGKLALMLKNEEPLMVVQGNVVLPEGMTVTGITSLCDIPGDGAYVSDGSYKFLFNSTKDVKIDASNEAVKIADIYVNVDNMEIGEYTVKNYGAVLAIYPIAESAGTFDEISSTVKVQKTAVIEPQRGDYSFEAVPTCVATGSTSMFIPVNFANEGYVSNISFNIEYPEGMLTTKSGKNYPIDVNKKRFDTGDDATLTVKAQSGINVSFSNGDDDLVTPGKGSLLSIPVSLTDVADGVYTIKFSDIKVNVTNDEADPLSTETLPDYYVSVIVGQPAAQEAILYGHYTKDAVNAFNTAMKNIAVANITATTIDNGVGNFQDVITVDDSDNWVFYFRKSENYATTVMPYDLKVMTAKDFPDLDLEEKEPYLHLFEIESMTSESIVIKECETIPANTPCIFKGVLSFLKTEEPLNLGSISEQDLGGTTFKGTYEATEIADGAGYYISSKDGKFYSDGASVRPFRGYFEGAIAGVKSFSVKLDTANGLIDITDQFSAEDIYSLQGIKMNKTQKGVNIVNGKKVYVK